MKKTIALALCLVAGVANAQTFVVNNLQINGAVSATNAVPLGALAQQAANTVVANTASIPASPSAVTVPSCSGTGSALQWISGTGFSCGSFQPTSQFPSSPYAFGAVGNGVTDDTAALQAWINFMGTTGQAGYCSPGTYKVTKTLNSTGQAVKITGPGGNACAITPSMPAGPTVSSATAGATYNPGASTSIRLTVSSTANIGTAVDVLGVGGTTEVNGGWPAVVIDSTHVDIVGPTFTHAYTSGGTLAFPVIAVVPATNGSAAQPQLDLSGVYFAPPTTNAASTDAMIFTGGAFNSPGSNVNIHENVINGYNRGMIFYQSYSPVIRYNYIYNGLGAAIKATQDASFANAHIEFNQLFSNANTLQESAIVMGGTSFIVGNPTILSNQASGNWNGLTLAGNVFGAQVIGNDFEKNNQGVGNNIACIGGNNNGTQIIGNLLFYVSGTNTTDLGSCTGTFFSGNFLTNNSFTMPVNSVVTTTNTLNGTAAINYPSTMPSSVVSSTVSQTAIANNTATNVTSVSLGSGNWECSGSTLTHPAGTTTQSLNITALNTVSATFPGVAPGQVQQGSAVTANTFVGQSTGPVYYSLNGPFTIYLVAQVAYATSTLTIDGDIHCHRVF